METQIKDKGQCSVSFVPEIEQVYDQSCQFRDFVRKKNMGCHYLQINKQLYDWYEKVKNADIDEMLNFKTMIESNEGYVVNYFILGETNALVEGINSKIQKFISSNQGTRNKDFFFFRLSNYYAYHIKIIFSRKVYPEKLNISQEKRNQCQNYYVCRPVYENPRGF